MIGDLHYQNAHWFLTSRVVPAWMALASTDRLSQSDRHTVLAIPKAISLLPEFDEQAQISVDIDFFWDDKNWIGRLTYANGVLELWQTLCEMKGNPPEMCAQWQNTATKLSSQKGLEKHDPAHLWIWSDCFARFVRAYESPNEREHGDFLMKLATSTMSLRFPKAISEKDEE
jgi:hypothetical protein